MFECRVGQIQKINSGTEKIRGGGISCRINLIKNDQTNCYKLSLSKSYIEFWLTHYLGFIKRRPISQTFSKFFPLSLLHTIFNTPPVFLLCSNWFFFVVCLNGELL